MSQGICLKIIGKYIIILAKADSIDPGQGLPLDLLFDIVNVLAGAYPPVKLA